MRDEDIKKAFGELNPTMEQKDRVFRELSRQSEGEHNPGRKRRRGFKGAKIVGAAASIVIVVFLASVTANASLRSSVISFFEGIFTPEEARENLISQVSYTGIKGFEVWAPDIFEVNDRRIIFGNRSGLIVYDRVNDNVATTLDLQAIDCAYFGGDALDTRVFVKDDKIIIYNLENGVPFGDYYIFDLLKDNEGIFTECEIGSDEKYLNACEKEWKSDLSKYFEDAFTEFEGSEAVEASHSGRGMYSRNLYRWDGGDSIIFVDGDNRFYLYTRDSATGYDVKEELNLGELIKPVSSTLQAYVYIGDDPVMKAATNELLKQGEKYYMPEEVDSVVIPLIYPVEIREGDGETLFYGNFGVCVFVRSGNTMESVSGGMSPGLMHISTAPEAVVTEYEQAEDGGGFYESVERMCQNDKELIEKLSQGVPGSYSEMLVKALKEYIVNNGLENEIKYLKEYGWDPIEIN